MPVLLSASSFGPDWPFVDREESVSAIFQALFRRWAQIDKNPFKVDKSESPLIGCQAVSGGGKSTLIDQLVTIRLDPNGIWF